MASYFDADDEVLSVDENEVEEYKPKKKTTNLKSTIHLENSDDDEDVNDIDDDNDDEQYGGADDDDDDEIVDVSKNKNKVTNTPILYENGDDEDEEEEVDDDDDDDEFNEEDLNENPDSKQQKKIKQLPQSMIHHEMSDDDEEEEEEDENYLKKFDKEINKNYIMNFHPECIRHNYDEIEGLTKVVRDSNNIVIDSLHRTLPYITKYERTRILGQRAKQINAGATPFVKVPENVIDGYLVAELELQQKRIPFIIQRPLPNGGCEYWNVKDLENISF